MIDKRSRNLALLVAGCFFMEILDGTIIVTAIPTLSASLGVEPNATGLVMTAYLVTVAALIPLSGWLTLRYGYRRVFLSAIAIFTLASLGCAASQSLEALVVLRVIQGIGGAMMVPVGRMVVFGRAEKSQVMRLMSFIVWPALIAPVIAPLAGGVITTYAGWQWMFLINIPLGVTAFVCAWRLIEGRPAEAPPRLDVLGVLLTCGGLGGLPYAAHLLSEQDPRWALAAVIGLASIALLAAATWHLLRTDVPLVDLRTLRIPTFGAAMAGGSLTILVIAAMPFLLPLLFQEVFHWSPIKSGAVVLVVFVGNLAIKPATTFLYNTFGFRRSLLVSSACLAATTIGCAQLTEHTPLVAILALVLVSGAARSVAMTGFTTLALSDVPPDRMRAVNALAGTAQQLCVGLAVAVATIALRLGDPLGGLVPGPDDPRTAYAVAFLLVTGIALMALAVVLRLHPSAGDVLTDGRAAGRSRASASE